jgi:hypothetical protein
MIIKHLQRNKIKYLLSIFFFSLSISLYEHLIRDRTFDWVLSTGWTGARHNAMNFWLDLFFGLNNNFVLLPAIAILGYFFIKFIRTRKYFTRQHFTRYKHNYILAIVIYHIVLTILYYTESLIRELSLTLFARLGLNISLYKSLLDGYYGNPLAIGSFGIQGFLIGLSFSALILLFGLTIFIVMYPFSTDAQQWKKIHELQDRINKQERELRDQSYSETDIKKLMDKYKD